MSLELLVIINIKKKCMKCHLQQEHLDFFQISASIDNVKYVFVYLKKSYCDANGSRHEETTPYKMDTFSLDGGTSLNNCRLGYGNGVFYPKIEYDSDSKVHILNDLMACAMRKNDYNSGSAYIQLNLSNYDSLFPRSKTITFQI